MNKLEYVSNKLNFFVEHYCEETKDVGNLNIELCEMLEFENEPLIVKLGFMDAPLDSLEKWNEWHELDNGFFYETSMEEIEELYQAICKFEEKQNSNFNNLIKDLPNKFQQIVKDSSKYGRNIESNKPYLLK